MSKVSEIKTPDTATDSKLAEITDKRGFGKRWGLSARTIDNLIARGMPAVRIGKRRVRLVIRECDQWVMEQYSTRRLASR